jgi:branched-subunit amino acid transport protein
MTFIPEEPGIKSSNRANFFEYFDRRRLSNRWIRVISYSSISILAAVKILSGIQRLNPDGETSNEIMSLF